MTQHLYPSTSATMVFYALPPELILLILHHVEEDVDLFHLAASCRLFNHLALDTYFLRHELDIRPPFKAICLRLDSTMAGPTSHMQALLLSIDLPRMQLEHLSYRSHIFHELALSIQGVEMLTRLISLVGRVVHLSLHLLAVPIRVSSVGCATARLLEAIRKNADIRRLEISTGFAIYCKSVDNTRRDDRTLAQDMDTTPESFAVRTLEQLTMASFPSAFRRFYRDTLVINQRTLTRLRILDIPRKSKKALTSL